VHPLQVFFLFTLFLCLGGNSPSLGGIFLIELPILVHLLDVPHGRGRVLHGRLAVNLERFPCHELFSFKIKIFLEHIIVSVTNKYLFLFFKYSSTGASRGLLASEGSNLVFFGPHHVRTQRPPGLLELRLEHGLLLVGHLLELRALGVLGRQELQLVFCVGLCVLCVPRQLNRSGP
jgi:hypothetical protein